MLSVFLSAARQLRQQRSGTTQLLLPASSLLWTQLQQQQQWQQQQQQKQQQQQEKNVYDEQQEASSWDVDPLECEPAELQQQQHGLQGHAAESQVLRVSNAELRRIFNSLIKGHLLDDAESRLGGAASAALQTAGTGGMASQSSIDSRAQPTTDMTDGAAAYDARASSGTTQLTRLQQQQQQQQQQQFLDERPAVAQKRLRKGLGFYWMWLRRLLLAKAVLSLLTSKPRSISILHAQPLRLPPGGTD